MIFSCWDRSCGFVNSAAVCFIWWINCMRFAQAFRVASLIASKRKRPCSFIAWNSEVFRWKITNWKWINIWLVWRNTCTSEKLSTFGRIVSQHLHSTFGGHCAPSRFRVPISCVRVGICKTIRWEIVLKNCHIRTCENFDVTMDKGRENENWNCSLNPKTNRVQLTSNQLFIIVSDVMIYTLFPSKRKSTKFSFERNRIALPRRTIHCRTGKMLRKTNEHETLDENLKNKIDLIRCS